MQSRYLPALFSCFVSSLDMFCFGGRSRKGDKRVLEWEGAFEAGRRLRVTKHSFKHFYLPKRVVARLCRSSLLQPSSESERDLLLVGVSPPLVPACLSSIGSYPDP